jgi:RimJ/RimL family protein N-acetyltransferase
MIIEKYGIKLIRLKESDIELLRLKRNSTLVNSLMHERNIISPEMQLKWFESINTIHNNYFIIEYNNQKIGLVNGKNSDYEKRQSEGGMFIWEQKYWGTVIPALCSIIMSDFTFFITGFNKNYIKILRSNYNAISYNKQLGYVLTTDFLSDEVAQWYVLTKSTYLKKTQKLRNGIRSITGEIEPLTLKDISFRDDNEKDLKLLYEPLPNYVKDNVNEILKKEQRQIL